jgi:hypothetical protein
MDNSNQHKFKLLLTALTFIAGAAGVGLALFALAAPMGVWLGMWNFSQGFGMLRGAQPFVAWITYGCIAITLLLLALGRQARLEKLSRMLSIAGAATLAAAIAWYIPQSYLPGEGQTIPPIHDISTDLVNPPAFVDVLPLRGENSNPTVYGTGNRNMTPEEHAQRQTEAYPDVVTQVFNEPPSAVFERARAAVDTLGWDLVASAPEQGRIEATDTTFWFRFKDDIVIRITETPEGSLLDARSTSRVGVSDVGKNAARLRAFFALL